MCAIQTGSFGAGTSLHHLGTIIYLKSEVGVLKAELDRVKGLNVELEPKNKKLSEDLAAAEAKMVVAVGTSGKEAIGEHQSPKFKDIQKPIADKLERPKVKKEATPEAIFRKASSIPSPTTTIHNHDMKRDIKGPLNHPQPVAISARSSIVGEIQNRSAHLLAIRVDNETKGEFINDLIKKAVDAAYMDIEEVLKFVDGMMGLMVNYPHWYISQKIIDLVDERAVLRHFKWPEKKANAMREAAVEYRELKLLEQEISSYKELP
ncbi:Protein CHUP1 [Arachis hypogaea]|nr:Protein CHUP1 [Arachis hypogaea]